MGLSACEMLDWRDGLPDASSNWLMRRSKVWFVKVSYGPNSFSGLVAAASRAWRFSGLGNGARGKVGLGDRWRVGTGFVPWTLTDGNCLGVLACMDSSGSISDVSTPISELSPRW